MVAKVTSEQARAALRLLDRKTVLFLLALLFHKCRQITVRQAKRRATARAIGGPNSKMAAMRVV